MALKIWDFDGFILFFWVSVTFQDFSYDMLHKKIKIILNYFLLKKGLSANIHMCEFGYSNCPFSYKLCFWSENLFQKKNKWEEGTKLKYKFKKEEKKGGRFLGGVANLFRWRNYEGLSPLNPSLPCPNNVNLYLHMIPKYAMRNIHTSKNGGGLGWTFLLAMFFLFCKFVWLYTRKKKFQIFQIFKNWLCGEYSKIWGKENKQPNKL
jgi:hypothetical protein